MNQLFKATVIALAASLSALAVAGGGPEEGSGKRFGPFEAITFNSDIVRDVKYESNGDIWLQLQPAHREKEFTVKLSNEYFAGYREWEHGGYELVSPADQGKRPYHWTDYVNTSAKYVEYWMEGEVFLHLKRVQ